MGRRPLHVRTALHLASDAARIRQTAPRDRLRLRHRTALHSASPRPQPRRRLLRSPMPGRTTSSPGCRTSPLAGPSAKLYGFINGTKGLFSGEARILTPTTSSRSSTAAASTCSGVLRTSSARESSRRKRPRRAQVSAQWLSPRRRAGEQLRHGAPRGRSPRGRCRQGDQRAGDD